MDLLHAFGAVAGPSTRDCHVIGYRYPAGQSPLSGESWVLRTVGERIAPVMGGAVNLTEMWRSPTGQVFIAETEGRVHHNPDPRPGAAPWRIYEVPFLVRGVWGMGEELVVAWGIRDSQPQLCQYDGHEWTMEPAPPVLPLCIRGLGADSLLAVGHDGRIARWDGEAWQELESPVRSRIGGLHVTAERAVACTSEGELLVGKGDEWSVAARWKGPLRDVAIWRDEVWAASTSDGLLKVMDGELQVVRSSIRSHHLLAADALLQSSDDLVGMTEDGKTFVGFRLDGFVQAISAVPYARTATPPEETEEPKLDP